MQTDSSNFVVLNVKRFPMIMLNQQAVADGYATQWIVEMSLLMEQGSPFVMVYDTMRVEESEADHRLRGQWLIQHRKELSKVCRGMISIETDTQRLDELMKVRKLFGIQHAVVSSEPYALALIHQWLA